MDNSFHNQYEEQILKASGKAANIRNIIKILARKNYEWFRGQRHKWNKLQLQRKR